MGIPEFFAWWRNQYYTQMVHRRLPQHYTQPAILYLDMNGILHVESRKVVSKWTGTLDSPSLKYHIRKSITNVINRIIRVVKPTTYVYMAIDGPAPYAKMVQQRSRRYKSVYRTKEINKLKKKHQLPIQPVWDSNQITPGTEFMLDIGSYLKRYYQKANWLTQFSPKLQIIISDAQVPGEGEHKAMEHLRAYKNANKNWNEPVVVYGLDADLIMLSLVSHHEPMFLIRESEEVSYKERPGEYRYIDMQVIKKGLLERINEELTGMFDSRRLIDDFIFYSFLLGNDFVPSIPSLRIREKGLNLVIKSYAKVLSTYNEYLVLDNQSINIPFLTMLLSELLIDSEKRLSKFRILDEKPTMDYESYLKRLEMRKRKRNVRRNIQVYIDPFEKDVYNLEKLIPRPKDEIKLGRRNYRSRYYKKRFNISPRQSKMICQQYLNIMRWTLAYYKQGCVDWRYAFKYEYAPFLKDLVSYLKSKSCKFDPSPFPFNVDVSLTPFEQLMVVLPPQSCSEFVPKAYSNLMSTKKLSKFYPKEVTLDCSNKRFMWQCPPILPHLDLKILLEELEKVELPKRYHKFNMFHNDTRIGF